MAKQDIVVIGGSTGSNVALREILGALPSDLQASVFVSTHIPAASDYLADALARFSTLPVRAATDGTPIQRGTVYVAVANHHLLLIDGTIRLGNGPARTWRVLRSTRSSGPRRCPMGRAPSA